MLARRSIFDTTRASPTSPLPASSAGDNRRRHISMSTAPHLTSSVTSRASRGALALASAQRMLSGAEGAPVSSRSPAPLVPSATVSPSCITLISQSANHSASTTVDAVDTVEDGDKDEDDPSAEAPSLCKASAAARGASSAVRTREIRAWMLLNEAEIDMCACVSGWARAPCVCRRCVS